MRDMQEPCCMLTDNGSYQPDSTVSLREVAARLSEKLGRMIHPVSLLHSTKINPEELGGVSAEIFEAFIQKKRAEGLNRFLVLPLFFGPSAAIKEYLPQRVAALKEAGWGELEVKVAPCLVDPPDPDDTRVACILRDQVLNSRIARGFTKPAVALVDHGAPRIGVTQVRNHLALQLRKMLDREQFPGVVACSMERREGDEYAFNEPLLERVIGSEGFQDEVIVSMLFASPGRHAGPGGDVAQICARSAVGHERLRWAMTDLVATHPLLLDVLIERYGQGIASDPV